MTLIYGREYDIYNAHNFPAIWVSAFASKVWRKKVFWTVHNFPQHGFTNPLASRFWERATFNIDQILVSWSSGIIPVSEKVSRQVKNIYHLPTIVVYPPVDVNYYKQGRGLKQRLLPMILIPTKIHEYKNPLFALKVIDQFAKIGGHAKFLIAGEGRFLNNLRKLHTSVGYLGFVPKSRLRDYYKKASLLFLPGDFGEGFNIVVLEALSVKTPSLVLKNSGIDDWLSANKVGFVTNRSVKVAADKLYALIKTKAKLKDYGERGYKLILAQNTPEMYAKKLIAIFDK
jgi:glycosyltransferase involved in cell wall biosynthesis